MPKERLPAGEKHRPSSRQSSGRIWSSGFADTSPYRPADRDHADDSDCASLFGFDWDFEPDDPNRNLDLSRRVDHAQYTSTPFTIAAKQADSSKSRNRSNQAPAAASAGPFQPLPAEKTIEEKLAEQEAADRRGGRPVVPAVEQKLPPHDNKKSGNNEWAWRNQGWVNAHGQPVTASRPPANSDQPKILDALNKIDKTKSKPKGRKRKVAEPGPEKEPDLVPPPRVQPQTILERLDDVKEESARANSKAAGPKKKTSGKTSEAPPAKANGKKKKNQGKDDDITFNMLPSGAAKNDSYPIVRGLEKMKSLPVKKTKTKREVSPSPTSSAETALPSLDLDEMLADADALSAKKKKPKTAGQARSRVPEEDEDGDFKMHEVSSDEREAVTAKQTAHPGKASSTYFEDRKLPSLDRTNATEPTDETLTPPEIDRRSGNPSTITHVSTYVPHMHVKDEKSSSSQLPYSSPALQRAQRGVAGRLASPRPVRAGLQDIVKLERMASADAPSRYDRPGTRGGTGFVPPIISKSQKGVSIPLEPGQPGRSNVRRPRDDSSHDIEMRPKEDEWSTLPPPKQSRRLGPSRLEADDLYFEHKTPRHHIPRFRQSSNPLTAKPGRLAAFKPTPRVEHPAPSERDDEPAYRLAVVPNGVKDVDPPRYSVPAMNWTGAQQRDLSERGRDQGGDEWVRQVKRARMTGHVEEGDWQEAWKAQNRREIEQNRHSQYAYQRPVQRPQDYSLGRAFS